MADLPNLISCRRPAFEDAIAFIISFLSEIGPGLVSKYGMPTESFNDCDI